MRWMKHSTLFLLLLLLVVLNSCASATVAAPRPTPLLLAATPAQTSIPVPTPPRSEIGPLPTNCARTALPGTKILPKGWGGFLEDTTLIGLSPVWGHIPPDLQIYVSPGTTDEPWTGTKIEWEVNQNLSQPATVRVKNLTTGELAWWGRGEQPPSDPILVLDAYNESYHGSQGNGWYEWGSALYLLTAGCYSMDVSWPGGAWHVVFAAGR